MSSLDWRPPCRHVSEDTRLRVVTVMHHALMQSAADGPNDRTVSLSWPQWLSVLTSNLSSVVVRLPCRWRSIVNRLRS
jgi:hypothetical protein